MKIYYQLNNNDCGISVTQSLIKHFFGKEINKEELYEAANLKEEGLSILDMENLNQKYGINLESYSMSFEEFKNYECKDFFVLLINRNGQPHYTIAKKNDKWVTLFDSCLGKSKISWHEFRSMWMDIFIKVAAEKSNPFLAYSNFSVIRDRIDKFRVSILFLINLSVLFLSILNAVLIKYSFNHVHNNYDFFNLVKLVLANIIFVGIFYLGEFLELWFTFKSKSFYSQSLYEKLVDSFKNKRNSYFHKLGKNQFLLLKDHIDCVSSYHAEYVNKWCISLFSLLIASIFLIFNHVYFLFLILASFVVQIVFWKLSKDNYYKHLPVLSEFQSEGKKLLHFLENLLKREINLEKLLFLTSRCKSNYVDEWSSQENLFIKNGSYSKANAYLNHLCYVISFVFIAHSVFSGNMSFGNLMMVNVFYFHVTKSFASLINYYEFKIRYDYSKQIYSQLLNVDSFSEKDHLEILPPKKIQIKDLCYSVPGKIIFQNLNLTILPGTLICGPSGSGKSVLYQIMSKKLNTSSPSVYFDLKDISSINPLSFRDLCIYQISDSYIDESIISNLSFVDLSEDLRNQILSICLSMNLDLSKDISTVDNLSSGQKQLINILNLFKYANKILFLDEIASHINIESRVEIYKHLIPFIASKNFVVCSEHSPEIIPFFSHVINLCSIQ